MAAPIATSCAFVLAALGFAGHSVGMIACGLFAIFVAPVVLSAIAERHAIRIVRHDGANAILGGMHRRVAASFRRDTIDAFLHAQAIEAAEATTQEAEDRKRIDLMILLVASHGGDLHEFALALHDDRAARAVLNETVGFIARHLPTFDWKVPLYTWVHAILYDVSRAHAEGRERDHYVLHPEIARAVEVAVLAAARSRKEGKREVRRPGAADPQDRALLHLRDGCGLAWAEMARVTTGAALARSEEQRKDLPAQAYRTPHDVVLHEARALSERYEALHAGVATTARG